MAENRLIIATSLILGSVLIDLLIGDPRFLPHPVEAMGFLVKYLQQKLELFIYKSKTNFRVGGFLITLFVVTFSGLSGWLLEQYFLMKSSFIPIYVIYIVLVFALASCLATKSLFQSVTEINEALNGDIEKQNIELARTKLTHIVGRDVNHLGEKDILRATAESASENAVDGIFAPLFWIMIGAVFWQFSPTLPGPLAMGWVFKASSTIDSMIGYKRGNLIWIGEFGARLDDILTFIPCRLVVLTLPLASKQWFKAPALIKSAWEEGSKDISPNSGLSEAIFAHCVQIRMGGINKYGQGLVTKPILAANAPSASINKIQKILRLTIRLEIIWVLIFILLIYLFP